MNNVPRPGNDGARSPQRAPAGSRGPEQAYPDPPRSWTRAGILIGTWVAAWAGVLVFGLGLQAMAHGQDDDPVLPGDSHAAVAGYFDSIFVYRDLSDAAALQCSDYNGPPPSELLAIVESWESANGERSGIATIDVITDGHRHKVTAVYGQSGSPSRALFWGEGAQEGDSYCVSQVTNREPDSSPGSEPDETTEAPGASESVSDFLAHIFRDEDRTAAEAMQCTGYQGVALTDLLAIPASHSHEGGGETLYDRTLHPRVAPDGMNEFAPMDFFHAEVTLDKNSHEFMVMYDPEPGQQCIAAVFDNW